MNCDGQALLLWCTGVVGHFALELSNLHTIVK
jgi:hypothetical protein